MTALAITIISALSVAVVVLLGVLAKLLGDLKWSETNYNIVRLTVDAMHARDRDSLAALRWARSLMPTSNTYQVWRLDPETGISRAFGGTFTDVLREIVACHREHLQREAERAAHDATERELDARNRLVPIRHTAKKGRAK